LLQQTKSEIRSLAGEIARLAHSDITPAEFYRGFLARLSTAMGASGGAIWQCVPDEHGMPGEQGVSRALSPSSTTITLVAAHQLPSSLVIAEHPTELHREILTCVLAEGQPILVPPAHVKLETDRPSNPLSDALIIVPVRVQEALEFVVEIVQRPTGGPAAQRGYLRFVAQMSDLLADYLRQNRLRELARGQQFADLLERTLCHVASAPSVSAQRQTAIDGLQQLLNSEHAILISHHPHSVHKSKVVAIAGTGAFDPRSELVIKLARFAARFAANSGDVQAENQVNIGSLPNAMFVRSPSRQPLTELTEEESTEQELTEQELKEQAATERPTLESALQSHTDELCSLLGCQRILAVRLGSNGLFSALISFADSNDSVAGKWPCQPATLKRIGKSLGTLLEPQATQATWQHWLTAGKRSSEATSGQSTARRWRRIWLPSVAVALALGLLAVLPVPQKIGAVATLKPNQSQFYYAPAAATVASVWVRDGDEVLAGQPLLTLENSELHFQILRLSAERTQQLETIGQLRGTLGKSARLAPAEKSDLEFKLHSYEQELSAIEAELKLREAEQERLTIRARQSGRVSSWGLENRLLGRPVVADDMLLSTYRPESDWHFEIEVPERRVGIVSESMVRRDGSLPVALVLSSYPDRILRGELNHLGAQTITSVQSTQPTLAERSVHARVKIDAATLPLRKDGAAARATIDCGQVPLVWLVIRDAYCQLSSRIQMLW
jgi:multidrug efflux pump subunit AcrA (membrane-fusion protein)